MSHLSKQLHEDARKRFEELGRSLLDRITTFRDPPSRKREVFSPNVFTGPTLTDAGIQGDVYLGGQDRHGKPTGIAVAEVGGVGARQICAAYAAARSSQ